MSILIKGHGDVDNIPPEAYENYGRAFIIQDPKPMTNADKIRAMTDEELAELLHSQFVFSNSYLPSELWLEWLKQEAE